MPERNKIAIAAAFTALCVIWSSTWLAIKVGLEDLPPLSFAALRFAIAIVALFAFSMATRVRLLPQRREDYTLLAVTGAIMFALNYGLLFWGELHVSSGLAAVLQSTIPMFGMIFAHWLLPAEPLRWQRMVGALVATSGVALICGRLLDRGGVLAFWAGLGILVGAAGASLSNVLLKRRALQLAPAMIAAWQMIFGLIPLLALGLVFEGNPVGFHWTGKAVFCLLYLAIIGSALTFLLLYWLLPQMGSTDLQTIALITPPGAVGFGWLLGGETFSLSHLFGAALVLAGVWMIFRKLDRRDAAEAPASLKIEMPRG